MSITEHFEPTTWSGLLYDARLAASLNSMEGVPDWPEVAESPFERSQRVRLQHQLHQVFQWLGTLLPGVTLAVLLALLGGTLSQRIGVDWLGFAKSPISQITLATLLGLAVRNTIGLPQVYESGLRVCLRWVLRGGIVLLGLRLSLVELGHIGLLALPVIVGCIALALVLVTQISRWLNLPPRLGSLIAVGTSICGVSAVVATGPVIDADDEEVSYAVACVTIFGMIALFCYPWLAFWLFGGHAQHVGLFLGTSIHDTAQVTGAALMYQQQFGDSAALDFAAVTKLVRNVCMAAVIPIVAILYHRASGGQTHSTKRKWHDIVPLFVLGFVAMAAARTIGDHGERAWFVWERDQWQQLLTTAQLVAESCLAVAMTAVGLGTSFAKLRRVGLKPLFVGLSAAVIVGGVSYVLIRLLAA
jgi:uncharacterized integral membrane protein (TIGR00698 family)